MRHEAFIIQGPCDLEQQSTMRNDINFWHKNYSSFTSAFVYAVSGSALCKEQKESQGMCLFIVYCTTPERVIIYFGVQLVNFLSHESLGLNKSDDVTQRQKN